MAVELEVHAAMLKEKARPRPRAIEFFSVLALLGWGIILILPMETFETAASYDNLEDLAPEWLWGSVALSLATVQLAGMAMACWKDWFQPDVRRMGLVATGAWWGLITVEFVLSNPRGTAWWVHLCLLAATMWAYRVAAREIWRG